MLPGQLSAGERDVGLARASWFHGQTLPSPHTRLVLRPHFSPPKESGECKTHDALWKRACPSWLHWKGPAWQDLLAGATSCWKQGPEPPLCSASQAKSLDPIDGILLSLFLGALMKEGNFQFTAGFSGFTCAVIPLLFVFHFSHSPFRALSVTRRAGQALLGLSLVWFHFTGLMAASS